MNLSESKTKPKQGQVEMLQRVWLLSGHSGKNMLADTEQDNSIQPIWRVVCTPQAL